MLLMVNREFLPNYIRYPNLTQSPLLLSGSVEHHHRLAAQRGRGADARPGPRALLADVALGGDQHCAGAVGDAARVAGGVKVPDLLRGRVRDDGDLIERLAIASGRL